MQVRLDALDEGLRFCKPEWAQFMRAEDGGALKPSVVLQAAAAPSS
jgi:hypothetical protein